MAVDRNKYAFIFPLCPGPNGGGNPVLSSSPVGAGGDIGPVPNGPHPSYQEYPPSPASWLSDVDSNANNPQYWAIASTSFIPQVSSPPNFTF